MGRRLRNSTLEILYNFPNSESSQSSQASRPQASQNTKPADLRALGRPAGLLTSVADVKADFFEGSYTNCFEYRYILSTAEDDWVPSTRQQEGLKLFLSCMRTPLADAACAKDHKTVLLLTEHGARLGDFAESLDIRKEQRALGPTTRSSYTHTILSCRL
jgi:hypothetical protein